MNQRHEDFQTAETLSEAADFILKDSFAIYKVDDETRNAIDNAWRSARRFFASTEKSTYHRVVKGHLHGFHIPSEAKMLYRAFCASPLQPWPNDEFQNASERVAHKLHKILMGCYAEMLHKTQSDNDDGESPRKRHRDEIPQTPYEAYNCPLDYFLYHGDKPNVASCTEHVDRGILICVCLTSVPGLEVLRGESFVCPEVMMHRADLYRDRQACSEFICIVCCDQLMKTLPEVKACVHRVRDELSQSRLSISYELRVP